LHTFLPPPPTKGVSAWSEAHTTQVLPSRAWVLKALPPGTASLAAALITLIGMALLLAIGAPPAAAQEQTGGAVVAWGDYEGGQTTVSPGFESEHEGDSQAIARR